MVDVTGSSPRRAQRRETTPGGDEPPEGCREEGEGVTREASGSRHPGERGRGAEREDREVRSHESGEKLD